MSGFHTEERQTLEHIKDSLGNFSSSLKSSSTDDTAPYWCRGDLTLPNQGQERPELDDAEAYALEALQCTRAKKFKARIVYCLTELKDLHCVCEVMSLDGKESVFFDHRRIGVATKTGMTDYYFLLASPCNLVINDPRPWLTLNQRSH